MSISRKNLTYRPPNTAASAVTAIDKMEEHLATLTGELIDTTAIQAFQNAIANGSTNRAYVSAGGKNVAVKNPEEVFTFVEILSDINATGFDAFLNLKKATVEAIDTHARNLNRANDKITDLIHMAEETIRTLSMDQVRLETQEEMSQVTGTPAVQAEPTVKMQAVMVNDACDTETVTNLLNTYDTVALAGRTFLQVPPDQVGMVNQIIANSVAGTQATETQPAEV